MPSRMKPEVHKKFTIYRAGDRPAPEVALYAHGVFATGWRRRYATVPRKLSVYFYVLHGVASADGSASVVVRGGAADGNQMVQMPGADGAVEQWLMWGRGNVTSIAPAGASVWDYELSHNDKTPRFVAEGKAGVADRDLLSLNPGVTMHLSDVFEALGRVGPFRILHYLPCRSPAQGNDFNPHNVNAAGALHKLCG